MEVSTNKAAKPKYAWVVVVAVLCDQHARATRRRVVIFNQHFAFIFQTIMQSSTTMIDLPDELWISIFDLAADEDVIFQPWTPTNLAEVCTVN